MLRRLADLPVTAPRRVLATAAAFAVVAGFFGLQTPGLLGRGSNDFVAQSSESLRAEREIERASGLSAAPQVLVLVRDPTRARLARVETAVASEPLFRIVSAPLRSRDGREALVVAYGRATDSQRPWREAAKRLDRRLAAVPGTAMGGSALATEQVNHQVQHDLTFAQAEVMHFLGHAQRAGRETMQNIARYLRIAPPSATALVTELEKKGLVRRRGDPGDRRLVHVSLTPAAKRLLAAVTRQKDAVFKKMISKLSPREYKELERLIRKLLNP